MDDNQQRDLQAITLAVMQLLDTWELDGAQIQRLLCLPADFRTRTLAKVRMGHQSLPDDPQVLVRANLLLRIADALRTAYPRNPRMSGRWIRQPHRRFGSRTPLTILLDDGEPGLVSVLSELDCTFSWDMTGSQAASSAPG